MLVDGDEGGFTFVAGGEIGSGGQEEKVSGLEFKSSYFAFEGLSFALHPYDNCVVARTEIRLFERTADEVTVVGDNDFEKVMTSIDFELFFDGFQSFWEEVEEFIDLVQGAGEKEGVVGLEGHLRGDRGDELAVAVYFCQEEVVEVSEACGFYGLSVHGSTWNDFELCGVLAVGGLVRQGAFLGSLEDNGDKDDGGEEYGSGYGESRD